MADEINTNAEGQTGGAGNPMQSGGIEQGTQQKSNSPEESGKTGQTATDKTYTQQEFTAELDKQIQQTLESEKAKWQEEYKLKLEAETKEAARLAKLSADERAKELQAKKEKEFEEKQAKLNHDMLEFNTTKLLEGKGLPSEFAAMLCGADTDTTKANIEAFEKSWNSSVNKAVEVRLKGNAPKGGGDPQGSDPFLMGFGN